MVALNNSRDDNRLDPEYLIAFVREHQGIYSNDIIILMGLQIGDKARSGSSRLDHAKNRIKEMESCPIFFQKVGGHLRWFTMDYAAEHDIPDTSESKTIDYLADMLWLSELWPANNHEVCR